MTKAFQIDPELLIRGWLITHRETADQFPDEYIATRIKFEHQSLLSQVSLEYIKLVIGLWRLEQNGTLVSQSLSFREKSPCTLCYALDDDGVQREIDLTNVSLDMNPNGNWILTAILDFDASRFAPGSRFDPGPLQKVLQKAAKKEKDPFKVTGGGSVTPAGTLDPKTLKRSEYDKTTFFIKLKVSPPGSSKLGLTAERILSDKNSSSIKFDASDIKIWKDFSGGFDIKFGADDGKPIKFKQLNLGVKFKF